jgi:Lrp/AsnC family leucine-responsive transcriptional regulator
MLDELLQNGRITLKELSNKLQFSAPTIAANFRELEEDEVIRKFSVEIDHEKAGFGIRAIVSMTVPLPEFRKGIDENLQAIPQVVRYYRVTGDFDYYVEIAATSLAELDDALIALCYIGKTQTSIILESHETGFPSIAQKNIQNPEKTAKGLWHLERPSGKI